jgi:hypothetical protein
MSLPGQNRAKMEASSSNDQKAYLITGAVFQHVPTSLLKIFENAVAKSLVLTKHNLEHVFNALLLAAVVDLAALQVQRSFIGFTQ